MNDMRNCGRGWRQVFFTLAIVWLPVTVIVSTVVPMMMVRVPSSRLSFRFEEVDLAFAVSGVVLFVVLGLLAPWVARGFTAEKKPPQ